MHVMVATDGSLDAKKTTELAAKLAADGGRVTVFTVVEVPRDMLSEMSTASGSELIATPGSWAPSIAELRPMTVRFRSGWATMPSWRST